MISPRVAARAVAAKTSAIIEFGALAAITAGVYDLAGVGWSLIAGGISGVAYAAALDYRK